jgi:hypothetical protein
LHKEDGSRILLDKNELPEDGYRTNGGAGLSEAGINRSNSELADDDSMSQITTKYLPNSGSFTSGNYHWAQDQTAVGVSDEKHVVPGTKFRDGLSSVSMSDDYIVHEDVHDQEFQRLKPEAVKTTRLVEEEVPSPLVGGVVLSQIGEDVDDESDKTRERKSSSGRTIQGDKKERLAPDEEVLDIILHKGSSGLGFTLAGGADTVGGCFVREIIGDPARADGRLRPKDQIVMVSMVLYFRQIYRILTAEFSS